MSEKFNLQGTNLQGLGQTSESISGSAVASGLGSLESFYKQSQYCQTVNQAPTVSRQQLLDILLKLNEASALVMDAIERTK